MPQIPANQLLVKNGLPSCRVIADKPHKHADEKE